MKRPLVLLLLLCLAVSFAQPATSPAFTDIQDSAFRSSISLLKSRGLISGFPDGTFRPRQAMTRAEFLAMVLRARGELEAPVAGQCLASLPAGAWYAPVICQGVSLGLISEEADQFRPTDTIIYAEALKIVLVAYGFDVEADAGGAWYQPYVDFASRNGILSVLAYRPADFVTREVAANILYRSMVLAGDNPPALPVTAEPEPVIAEGPAEPEPEAPEPEPEPAAQLPEPEPAAAACPSTVPAAPGSLVVNGVERSFLTHLPNGLQPGRSVPLIVAFHGRTNSNAQVQRYMRLEGNGDDAIIVYPAGMSAGGGTRNWNDPGDSAADLRDFALFDAIVEYFSSQYCIDQNRIFVVGHSLGAYFANSVACARAHVVRAVASVAGGIQTSNCSDTVAALLFHNPNDSLVAISEGERARDIFLNANSVSSSPVSLGDAFNCRAYDPGSPDRTVTWCPHGIDHPYGNTYDPHSWPAAIGPYVMQFFASF